MRGKLSQDQLDDIPCPSQAGNVAQGSCGLLRPRRRPDLIEIASIRTAAYEIEQEEQA